MSKAFLKVKICSLAAEAVIIRRAERRWKKSWRARKDQTFFALKNHRTGEVRSEQRAALLAYGFLRGRPYLAIENKCYEEPNWTRVAELVRKYAPERPTKEQAIETVSQWRDVDALRLVFVGAGGETPKVEAVGR